MEFREICSAAKEWILVSEDTPDIGILSSQYPTYRAVGL
jgi:hypothetical protein